MQRNITTESTKAYINHDSFEQGIKDHERAGFKRDESRSSDEKTILTRSSTRGRETTNEIVTLTMSDERETSHG